jgi:hypothetical protein
MSARRQRGCWGARRVALCALGALVLAGCGSVAASITTAASQQLARGSSSSVSTVATTTDGPVVPLPVAAAGVEAELRGIPQHGLVLGRANAPVTIVEYADLLCTECAAVHDDVLPAVIAGAVRSGRATLELRPVVGSSASGALAVAAYAAGVQGRGWQFVQLAYRRIGIAGSPAEPAQALASALAINLPRWRGDLGRASWKTDIAGALDVVRVAGFSVYPVFLITNAAQSPTKAPLPYVVLTDPASARSIDLAIAKALARRG